MGTKGKEPNDGNVVDLQLVKEMREAAENNSFSLKELFSDDPFLEKMNEKHAFIHSYGGKPAVLSYVYSEAFNKDIMEFVTPDAISIRYCNQSVKVGNNQVELGKWWLRNSHRREYRTVIFDPSKPKEHDGCLNLWEGFSIEAKMGSWYHTKRHIYRILCNKDKAKFKYVMRWFAWCIQNPADRPEVSVIFKGKKGAGKGFIFTQFVELFGRHGIAISNREYLTGNFNGHLSNVVFLFADEAYYPGDKEIEGVMKQLITEPKIAYNAKYKEIAPGTNRLHIGMATNTDWVIPASEDERRYFINSVDNKYAKGQCSDLQRKLYFSILWEEMKHGGQSAMLYDMQRMDLKGWHPRDDVPDTEELLLQKKLSLSTLNAAIFQMLEDGAFPGEKMDGDYFSISSENLVAHIEKIEPATKRFSNVKKLEVFRKLGAIKKKTNTKNYWVFPPLKEMRDKFSSLYVPHKWPDGDDEWYIQRTQY